LKVEGFTNLGKYTPKHFFSDFPHLIKCLRNFFTKHTRYQGILLKHWIVIFFSILLFQRFFGMMRDCCGSYVLSYVTGYVARKGPRFTKFLENKQAVVCDMPENVDVRINDAIPNSHQLILC
ncbi:hypothetical protein ALC56_13059, partial [Trachymyrmex septentrionalis]